MGFNIDFSQFAPSTKPLKLKAIPTALPTVQPKPTVQPTPQPAPAPVATQQPENQSWIQQGFNLLNKPSELVQSGVTRLLTGKDQTYEDALKGAGVQNETVRNVAGFAGRLIADPLNLLAPLKVAKYLGKGAKLIPGVTKAAGIVSKVPEIPFVKKAVDAVGERFVRGYKLPETYNVLKSEIPTKIAQGSKQIIERTKGQFKPFTQAAIEATGKFLEPKVAGAGEDLRLLKESLGTEFEKLQPVMHEVKKQFKQDIYDLVQRGRMTGETAKKLLTQGGYYPHTDFAPARIKEFFAKPKIGEKRVYLEKRKGLQGFTYNAPKAISRREISQFNDNIIQDFFREVRDQFGVKIGKGSVAPEGYKVFLSNSPRTMELRGWALPARIADDINASISTGGTLGKAIDTFNALWKPTATSMNPAFHFMNVIGNMYNSWLGGMKDPRRFIQAVKGGFDAGEKEILERSGILARGQFGADVVSRTFDNPEGIDTLRIFEPFRKSGEFFENNARSAFFLDQRENLLRKGLSDAEATRQALSNTNKYLFDYLTGLTPFETNVMRRVFPFYTWARFNIPLQFRSIIEQPGKVAAISKLQKDLNKDGIPEGDQEGVTVPTPFVDENGDPIRWKPNLPVQDIFNMNPQRVLSMVNPLLKDVPQLATWAGSGGKIAPVDTFSGQPRTDPNLPFSEQAKDVVGSMAKSSLRPVRTYSKMEEADFSPEMILRQAAGGTYTLPKQQLKLRSVREKLNKNQAIQNRVERINSSNLTQEEKDRQIERLLKFLK